jgi:hypothetical protein
MAATLDDKSQFKPEVSLFCEQAPSWVEMPKTSLATTREGKQILETGWSGSEARENARPDPFGRLSAGSLGDPNLGRFVELSASWHGWVLGMGQGSLGRWAG